MANMKNRWFYSVCGVLAMLVFMAAGPLERFTPYASSTFTTTAAADTDEMVIVKVAHINGSTTLSKALALDDVWLYKVVTVPHASGTVTLTDNWDLYIKDVNGIDVLGAAGENRDQTNKEQAFPLVGSGQWEPVYMQGPMTFSVSGNSVVNIPSETYLFLLKDK